jgi:hypothetical protein
MSMEKTLYSEKNGIELFVNIPHKNRSCNCNIL